MLSVFPNILFAIFFCSRVSAKSVQGRFNGGATLLNRRIYYFGGAVADGDISQATASNSLLYLDITNSFSVDDANAKWESAPIGGGSSNAEQAYNFAMVVVPNEQAIMVYGGDGASSDMDKPAMMYYAKDEAWREYPNPLPSLKQMAMGSLSRGDGSNVCFFGGRSVLTVNPIFPPFSNAMHIYDYKAGSWSNGATLPDGLPLRFGAARALTGAGKEIVYIGGMTATYNDTAIIRDNIPISFTDILIYNTVENTWRQENATGNIPSSRISHSLATKPNSRQIIMYGGQTNQISGAIQGNYCYTLNVQDWTWVKKNPIGVGPGPLYGHSAMFPDGSPLLFVMFGVNSTGQASNKLGVLNTETWSWSNYQSSYSGSDSPTSGDFSEGLSSGTLAGIVVGCLVGVGAIIGTLVFLCIRRRRNKKQHSHMAILTGESKPEAHVLRPMSPLISHAPSYKLHDEDKEHLYSNHPEKNDSSAPSYISATDDVSIFLHPTKPDDPGNGYGAAVSTASEKPDGAVFLPTSDGLRPMKPDGA